MRHLFSRWSEKTPQIRCVLNHNLTKNDNLTAKSGEAHKEKLDYTSRLQSELTLLRQNFDILLHFAILIIVLFKFHSTEFKSTRALFDLCTMSTGQNNFLRYDSNKSRRA